MVLTNGSTNAGKEECLGRYNKLQRQLCADNNDSRETTEIMVDTVKTAGETRELGDRDFIRRQQRATK